MKKFLLASVAALIITTPVMAEEKADPPKKTETARIEPEKKGVTITFTEDELNVVTNMIDQALRACGIKCAGNAAYLVKKIQDAKAANK